MGRWSRLGIFGFGILAIAAGVIAASHSTASGAEKTNSSHFFSTATLDEEYRCPLNVWHAGAVETPSGWFEIWGSWPLIQQLPPDPQTPNVPKGEYAMGSQWYPSIPRGAEMKADRARGRCLFVEVGGGVYAGQLAIYQLVNLQIRNKTDEEVATQCPDGSYVDDPSYCPESSGSGGGGGGEGGGGGGSSGGGYYYLCHFTYWSDGTTTVDWCQGPFSYN